MLFLLNMKKKLQRFSILTATKKNCGVMLLFTWTMCIYVHFLSVYIQAVSICIRVYSRCHRIVVETTQCRPIMIIFLMNFNIHVVTIFDFFSCLLVIAGTYSLHCIPIPCICSAGYCCIISSAWPETRQIYTIINLQRLSDSVKT